MTTAAAIPTNGTHVTGLPLTVAEQCVSILAALDPPKLDDMRKRCAASAKAAGASDKVVSAILAVPLVAGG